MDGLHHDVQEHAVSYQAQVLCTVNGISYESGESMWWEWVSMKIMYYQHPWSFTILDRSPYIRVDEVQTSNIIDHALWQCWYSRWHASHMLLMLFYLRVRNPMTTLSIAASIAFEDWWRQFICDTFWCQSLSFAFWQTSPISPFFRRGLTYRLLFNHKQTSQP